MIKRKNNAKLTPLFNVRHIDFGRSGVSLQRQRQKMNEGTEEMQNIDRQSRDEKSDGGHVLIFKQGWAR